MKKIVLKMLLISIIVLSSCGSQKEFNAATAAENYINALAKKNKSQVVALSCKEWEESATLEVDALLSVSAEVTGLKCEITGEDNTGTYVM
jgi:flavorubredoxin